MKPNARRWLAYTCAGALFLSAQAVARSQAAVKGDFDGDGILTAADARLTLRSAVGLEQIESGGAAFAAADVTGDGALSAEDARLILRAAVGLTDIETLEDISYPETSAVPRTTEPATEPTTEPTTEPMTEPTTEPPTEPTTEPTTTSPWPVSAKGFEIRTYNGVTYVGGVLIANKTYGLPRSYGPGDLTDETYAAFRRMQRDGWNLGLNLYISSGYRSYDLQSSLYNRYVRQDGRAMADRYSARPGHSEHQTGLAFDLNTITQSFAYTAEGKWVAKNCWKYGFILRYPKEKEAITGYMYEPWHLRYLGEDLAEKVYRSGLCLEEYLGVTSEYQ